MATAADFQAVLNQVFKSAKERGLPYVDVAAGDLYRMAEGHPAYSTELSACIELMKKNKVDDDVLLRQPPPGTSAAFEIRYKIPR